MRLEIETYMKEAKQWREQLEKLREIALDCGLAEDVRWGKPAYTLNGKIIVLLQGFKNYCCLLFMKGDLMKDPDGLFSKIFKNRDSRRIEFAGIEEILMAETAIRAYIAEAVELEK